MLWFSIGLMRDSVPRPSRDNRPDVRDHAVLHDVVDIVKVDRGGA
jgi:hypothetical protein